MRNLYAISRASSDHDGLGGRRKRARRRALTVLWRMPRAAAALFIMLAASPLPASSEPRVVTVKTPATDTIALGEPANASEPSAADVIPDAARQDLPSDDTARAIVRSYETAAIGSELNARITYLPAREGDRFRKGDLLVAFDCRRIEAERDAAGAAMKAADASYQNQKRLLDYKSAGTATVEQALHQYEKSKAEFRSLEVRAESCRIVAPFDGRVTAKAAQVHEIAQPNQELVRIINESKIELVLMVPSAWLPRIGADTVFSVDIDETGERHIARVLQTTGQIDPVSQSVRLIAELTEPAPAVLPGMSGTATFAARSASK